jgi:hypothetical protein
VDDLSRFRDGRDAVVSRTATQAPAVVGQNRSWDEIGLDHDLGDATGQVETMRPVIDLLCAAVFHGHPIEVGVLVVHTANPVGRVDIVRGLTAGGYRPVVLDARRDLISY